MYFYSLNHRASNILTRAKGVEEKMERVDIFPHKRQLEKDYDAFNPPKPSQCGRTPPNDTERKLGQTSTPKHLQFEHKASITHAKRGYYPYNITLQPNPLLPCPARQSIFHPNLERHNKTHRVVAGRVLPRPAPRTPGFVRYSIPHFFYSSVYLFIYSSIHLNCHT